MFTGIIEAMGHVEALKSNAQGARLFMRPEGELSCALGDSLSVSGACLTVAAMDSGVYEFDLSHETLKLTILGALLPGDLVNLERALKVGDRLGGHFVSGHVDGIGSVKNVRKAGDGAEMEFIVPVDLALYVAQKGSISVDGVSLTSFSPSKDGFTVALIPHTLLNTTLGHRKPGDAVNLEVDLLARHVKRLMEFS